MPSKDTTPKTPYGDVKYADPGYQEDGVKRYPIDTETHIRAAWAYINMPKNAAKYNRRDLERVRKRIITAMREIGANVDVEAAGWTDALIAHSLSFVDTQSVDNVLSLKDMSMASLSVPWEGVITVEGIQSGDHRLFSPNALTWDEPPLPFMWQKETSHGGDHDVTVRVGTIDNIWRESSPSNDKVFLIKGSGRIDLGCTDGREVFRRMRNGYMTGNSVDVDSVNESSIEFQYPNTMASSDDSIMNTFTKPELTIYHQGRIRATTIVEIPAFTEARISLIDKSDASPSNTELDSIIKVDDSMAQLTAAATIIEIPDAPLREWFDEPRDVTPNGALTVTNCGRIYGFVAPSNVRHRSWPDRAQYVPTGNVDYSRFMSGETIVADGGRIVTGKITMNCGHASTSRFITATKASDHYDNSCSIVATVRVGENEHGVWIAGALISDLTPATIQRIMSCSLSGDWRPHLDKPGWREFVAALLVPVPGFPMARTAPSVEFVDGELVASCVPVEFIPDSNKYDITTITSLTPLQRKVAVARLRAAVCKTRKKVS